MKQPAVTIPLRSTLKHTALVLAASLAIAGGARAQLPVTNDFWNTNKSWTNVFTGDGATNNLSSIFSSISGAGLTWDGSKAAYGNITPGGDGGYFTFSGTSTLSWTAVPEPTSALAGLLLGAGLLRRRR